MINNIQRQTSMKKYQKVIKENKIIFDLNTPLASTYFATMENRELKTILTISFPTFNKFNNVIMVKRVYEKSFDRSDYLSTIKKAGGIQRITFEQFPIAEDFENMLKECRYEEVF